MSAFVNPVLRSLTLNVSTAFATMQVSNCRRASNAPSVNKGASAMYDSFQDPISNPRQKSSRAPGCAEEIHCLHSPRTSPRYRGKVARAGCQKRQPSQDSLSLELSPRFHASRTEKPRAPHCMNEAEFTGSNKPGHRRRRKISRKEEDGCTDLFRGER